eukprot:TRINITY_DN6466_c0_g1_i1.p1 TRINITY_DN6466_c0_g1~~TRINITY_DN6466_c0_g1_i1.p1  ORF type:complete len:210 (+),score=34.34 TRINITY_DN6466_c0_g1_i1:354-983(+)
MCSLLAPRASMATTHTGRLVSAMVAHVHLSPRVRVEPHIYYFNDTTGSNTCRSSMVRHSSSGSSAAVEGAPRPPLPPFTEATAREKVQLAEDAWNTRDPARIALAYSVDTEWRNRDVFLNGRDEVVEFLTKKWARESDYRLKKELWTYLNNRIAVRFQYEWRDKTGQWWRSHGNENWEFDSHGYMSKRYASINDQAIQEEDRLFRWERA